MYIETKKWFVGKWRFVVKVELIPSVLNISWATHHSTLALVWIKFVSWASFYLSLVTSFSWSFVIDSPSNRISSEKFPSLLSGCWQLFILRNQLCNWLAVLLPSVNVEALAIFQALRLVSDRGAENCSWPTCGLKNQISVWDSNSRCVFRFIYNFQVIISTPWIVQSLDMRTLNANEGWIKSFLSKPCNHGCF